eukprot:6144412-Pyramimonas_sp.AAC.1
MKHTNKQQREHSFALPRAYRRGRGLCGRSDWLGPSLDPPGLPLGALGLIPPWASCGSPWAPCASLGFL